MTNRALYLGIASGVWALGFAIAVAFILIIATLAANPDPKERVGDITKIAGIGLTALFSIATFVLTFATERKKLDAAREFEKAKIAATMEISAAGIAAQKEIEKAKIRYMHELELGKRRLELEATTYNLFTKAAAKLYRAVEDCRFRPAEAEKVVEAANSEMRDADAYNMWLSKELSVQWYTFWQQGRNLADVLRASPDEKEREQIWRDSAKTFGKTLRDFQTTFIGTSIFATKTE